MTLEDLQVKKFHEYGYLKIDDFFTDLEIDLIRQEIAHLNEKDSPQHIYEKNGALRSILGPHLISPFFLNITRLNKIAKPALQLLSSDEVYLFQAKINHKLALSGACWDWHQDFLYWHKEDGLPHPGRSITVAIFLDDVDTVNGPLMLIPCSHQGGTVDLPLHSTYKEAPGKEAPGWEAGFDENLKYQLSKNQLNKLLENREVYQATGEKGFALLFNDMIFHGSNCNMSGKDRTAIFFTYSDVNNIPKDIPNPRPEFSAARDHTPINNFVSSVGPPR